MMLRLFRLFRRFMWWLRTPKSSYVSDRWLAENKGHTYDDNPRAKSKL